MIDNNQLDYEIIDGIIDNQIEKNKIDALIFFLQILKYLKNVSPKKIKFIIDKSLNYCFKSGEKTKEHSKRDYREVIFTQLVAIGNNERFTHNFKSSFIEFVKASRAEKSALNIFALEFTLVSGNTSLIDLLKKENLELENEYIFILNKYPLLFDANGYLANLKEFISKYGTKSIKNNFKSLFNQKLFFNTTKFNWIITYISRYLNKDSSIKKVYTDLINSGIQNHDLMNCVMKNSLVIDIDLLERIVKTSEHTDEKAIRNFIGAIRQKNLIHTKPVNKTQFYDRYFIDRAKRKF